MCVCVYVCMRWHRNTLVDLEGGGGDAVQGEQILHTAPVLMLKAA